MITGRMFATLAGALGLFAGLTAQGFAQEPTTLGEMNSYTTLPAFTGPYRKGWELALEEINAAGGIDGRPVAVVSRDDNGKPADAIRIAEEFVASDDVAVVWGGFFSNVTAPRALRLATSDFAAETVIDMTKVRTCAGGLLVFVNDHTLLRFGVGLQYEGEVTLTVKSARTGFAVVARGLIANAHHVHLRLQRRGDLVTA